MPDRYAVIGHPIAHSKSPWIHAQFALATGESITYEAIDTPADGFVAAVEKFRAAGGKGLNVTLPFKEQAFRYCGGSTARAAAAQAVNTLLLDREQPFGDNTDGIGLVRDLSANLGRSLGGAQVLLLGAGGAAQGVLAPLAATGAAAIVIANRTPARAQALAARLPGVFACGFDALGGRAFDLVVNATSAGLSGDLPRLPQGLFRHGALAYDMIYGRDTEFLAMARAAGAATSDGLGMLVEQAAESYLVWRGVRPDTRPVLAALRAR
ncbi:MAG: shikimate dehydrogenase [Burkholderiales bacterium]